MWPLWTVTGVVQMQHLLLELKINILKVNTEETVVHKFGVGLKQLRRQKAEATTQQGIRQAIHLLHAV